MHTGPYLPTRVIMLKHTYMWTLSGASQDTLTLLGQAGYLPMSTTPFTQITHFRESIKWCDSLDAIFLFVYCGIQNALGVVLYI